MPTVTVSDKTLRVLLRAVNTVGMIAGKTATLASENGDATTAMDALRACSELSAAMDELQTGIPSETGEGPRVNAPKGIGFN
jgi:hypothetical protein